MPKQPNGSGTGGVQCHMDRSGEVGGRRSAKGSDISAGNSVKSTPRSLSDNRAQAVITRNRDEKNPFRGNRKPW